ncbi:MAG: peroxiredoxin [Chloroflexi bacterium]|nr:peroxiredoxin [Chloroflexota bacterium]
MSVQVGQKAPEFALFDADKKLRKLSEFKGKNVVLAFFPGAFTGVCTKEMCTFRDSISQFNSLNAQVLGISVDPPFSQKAWADQNQLNFPILSDFNRQAVKQYDVALPNLAGLEGYVAAKRAAFVLDKEGTVRYAWVAPQPSVEPNYEEVKQALAALPK